MLYDDTNNLVFNYKKDSSLSKLQDRSDPDPDNIEYLKQFDMADLSEIQMLGLPIEKQAEHAMLSLEMHRSR